MPEGESSYFVNAADRKQDRFEDYIVKDSVADVEVKRAITPGRSHRAIAGVSMGGFGAVNLALRHPDLFVFAGGLSAALDVPSRPFSIKRIEQGQSHRAIFGSWDGQVQHDNDPFVLARSADPGKTRYLYLTSGQQEGLLPRGQSVCFPAAAAAYFVRVPHGPRWARLEPMECTTSSPVRKPAATPSGGQS